MVNPVYPGVVVALGGDMITGAIHEELAVTNWGTTQQQFIQVQEALEWALIRMADAFGKVFVPCVVGNHGRDTIKPRFKNRVFQNYEWNLYMQLARTFSKDKRFRFLVPEDTDAHFKIYDHRFLLTHGDTLGVKGGDGIIGALGPIARGATKVGRAEAQIGRDFDTLLMGHYHTYIPSNDAVPVIVNGALKGYDEYARSALRVRYSRPSQALWFVHPNHGITAQWQVFLDERRKAVPQTQWLTFEGKV
jgi:predicted phosphodiesterase